MNRRLHVAIVLVLLESGAAGPSLRVELGMAIKTGLGQSWPVNTKYQDRVTLVRHLDIIGSYFVVKRGKMEMDHEVKPRAAWLPDLQTGTGRGRFAAHHIPRVAMSPTVFYFVTYFSQ